MAASVEVCVRWKALDLIVTVEECDCFSPDEWIPTAGTVELDYRWIPECPHPADEVMRGIQAQINDEPERFFDRICKECEVELYEKGYEAYAAQQIEEAQSYAAGLEDYLYDAKESRRSFGRDFN